MIKFLNSILWDISPRKITNKRIYKTVAQSGMICRAKAWDVSRKNGNKLLAAGMDRLRRSCRRTRLDRTRNETITEMVVMEKDITDEVHK
jgi:creatinine amidohydrolase/Fe(II)-dependent formamide hydrolase-like protein